MLPRPRSQVGRRLSSFFATLALCIPWQSAAAQHLSATTTIFDADPNHPWNHLYACLLIRQNREGKQFGADVIDPLLWYETRHLLIGASHQAALGCLDNFLRSHAESAIQDPLKHAILQRDLWAIFDWAAQRQDPPKQRSELESRLATVIHRLSLTPDQIRALPDNYAAAVDAHQIPVAYDPQDPRQPFLPPDIFNPDGAWICLSVHAKEPTALGHFSGRSRFFVFMRLPGGRDATLAYLQKLRSSGESPFLADSSGPNILNLAVPQFPVGTEFALVRQAILLDSQGNLVPTAITESIQLRVYHSITPGSKFMNYVNGPSSYDQDFFEFEMSRSELFAQHNGGLLAVHPSDTEYSTFSTHGEDPFEATHSSEPPTRVLQSCVACHADSGIHSVRSRAQWMNYRQEIDHQPMDGNTVDSVAWETHETIARKQQQPEFCLLQSFWRSTPN